jgi:hypothetical protein
MSWPGRRNGLWGLPGVATGYMTVYALEIVLLLATIVVIVPLLGRLRGYAFAEAPESQPGRGTVGADPVPDLQESR